MSLNINWLDAITNKVINPEAVYDIVFRRGALLAYLRRNRFQAYTGGVSMDNAFLYRGMVGGAFAMGGPMSTDVIEPIAGQTFTPRQYYSTVAHYLEQLAINRGPAAVFDALRIKHRAAMNTLNTIWDIALYKHGQASATGVTDDRSIETNGLDEALNDGRNQGPFGNWYTAYGGQTRNDGNVGNGYNSIPYFCGNSTTGAGGQITYHHMITSYLRPTQGDEMPDIGLTNKSFFGFLLERIQSQQIFEFQRAGASADVVNAVYGANAIKFMKADIMVDQYCPSTINGESTPFGSNLLGTFTCSTTNTAASNLPSDGSATVTAGEALYWINSGALKFRLSNMPLWNFGWKGYVPESNGTKIVGQVLSMGTMEDRMPWLGNIVYGVTS